jgi:hypothetical protein
VHDVEVEHCVPDTDALLAALKLRGIELGEATLFVAGAGELHGTLPKLDRMRCEHGRFLPS